jgi:hypothetical protein
MLVVVGTVVVIRVLLVAVIVDVAAEVVAIVAILGNVSVVDVHVGLVFRRHSREKGDFFHDGRFATLSDVVDHYHSTVGLVLTDPEKTDRIEYLKSL